MRLIRMACSVSASTLAASTALFFRLLISASRTPVPRPISAPIPGSAPPTTTPFSLQLILEVNLRSAVPIVPSAHAPAVQLVTQLPTDRLQMHKVAESRPGAFSSLVLPAASLAEIGDGGQLSIDRSSSKPSIVEVVDGLVGILLPLELDVDVADQVVSQIVAHIHLLNLSVFVLAFDEDIFEEVVVVLLHLFVGDIGEVRPISSLSRVLGVDVQVLEKDGLGEGWLVVNPGASLSVGTSPHLEEEGAVDLVLLRSEDRGEILRHFE